MRVGIDLYSLRLQGWNAFEHLEYCASIGVDVVHFSESEPFESLDDAYLQRVRQRADELGLSLEVGMYSICPTSGAFDASAGTATEQVQQMLRVAEVLGSPVLRCLLGTNADRHGELPLSRHIAETVAVCQAVRDQCLDLGIKLAVENHAGDMQGRELKALIEAAGPEHVGACIDPGNAVWVAEDPMVTLDHLAPYVAACHARDSAVWPHPRGCACQWVAMGQGNVGIGEWARSFQERCPGVSYTMEIITGMPPKVLNYLEPSYWEDYQETPAWEFARFEALVRRGEPYLGPMLTAVGDVPVEYRAAMAVQQRVDVERSVRWCREELGFGER